MPCIFADPQNSNLKCSTVGSSLPVLQRLIHCPHLILILQLIPSTLPAEPEETELEKTPLVASAEAGSVVTLMNSPLEQNEQSLSQ